MRIIRGDVAAPTVPDAVTNHAMALAREKALQATDDRVLLLRSSCAEVNGTDLDVAILPTLPDSTGTVTLGTVELWNDTTAAFEATTAYTVRPSNRLRLHRPGTWRITASVDAPADLAPEFAESAARLWAFRENRRPGDVDLAGASVNLSGAMQRSGAAEVIRHMVSYGA